MKRTATGFCLAAAFGCIATLGAQTSTTPTTAGQPAATADKARDVTITGCLSKGADGKFMLTNAMMDKSIGRHDHRHVNDDDRHHDCGDHNGHDDEHDHAPRARRAPPRTSWMLAGGSDLDKHVGHKIQVTGKTSWDSMDTSRTPASTPRQRPATGAAGTTRNVRDHGDRRY